MRFLSKRAKQKVALSAETRLTGFIVKFTVLDSQCVNFTFTGRARRVKARLKKCKKCTDRFTIGERRITGQLAEQRQGMPIWEVRASREANAHPKDKERQMADGVCLSVREFSARLRALIS